jgi:hypothetical protein
MTHQLFLPFATVPPEADPRSRAGQIVRVQRAWDPEVEMGRYWHLRFSTTFRRVETDAIRLDHPDWSARKVDTLALERAKPFGDPDIIRHYARAIPHGTFPGEVRWLQEPEITPTDLTWRIPPWDDIQRWFARDGNRSEFTDELNAFSHPGDWHQYRYPPLTGEEDLVRLLAGIDPFWAHFHTHGTFPLSPSEDGTFLSPAETGLFPLFA